MIPLNARNIRFSCAYLFRIKINDKYLLVKDEQGRNTFQPVGGVYKYTDSSFFSYTHAIQCTRFGNNSDLDCDLRINVPRNKALKFWNWYKKEQGRETPKNLYREFQEEILDRIDFINPIDFKTLEYRFCGQHIEYSRLGEHDLQIRIADVVELIPTPQQTKAFLSMMEHESSVYYFATKDEIYHEGRVNGNQVQTISPHSYKILPEEEHRLKRTKHNGKIYKCHQEFEPESLPQEVWSQIEKADTTKTFTFISYNSLHGKKVWDFCCENRPPLDNIWIDRKLVSENWLDDVKTALTCPECKKAILFINKEYLIRSTACYQEASLIVDNNIPHVIVLIDVDMKFVHEQIKTWIYSDLADKNKLRIFKKLFDYDDDTGHINASMYLLSDSTTDRVLESYCNL